jgi:cell division transport system permease protein
MLQAKLLKLYRTFKEGWANFYRNGWLSFATMSILAISLYIISVTMILGIAANLVLKNVQDQVNVSVYFNQEVSEQQIMDIKSKLSGYQEIDSIKYISREQALEDFKRKEAANPSINKALEQFDDNPLLSALVIKAKSPEQYDLIVKSISGSVFSEYINKINYEENKLAIERLNTVIKLVEQVGLTLGIVFIFIGILITFNAIRLTMYAQKQEFEVKRLVGASNLYIRMPFVFEGIFYGIAAAVIVFFMLWATSKIIAPLTEGTIPQGNLLGFFYENFGKIFFELFVSGIALGVVSGFIAIRRYLKI